MVIKINKVDEPEVDLYGPDDKLIGKVKGDLQLLDVRVQIKEQKLEGYYILHKKKRIALLPTGAYKEEGGKYPYTHHIELVYKLFGYA